MTQQLTLWPEPSDRRYQYHHYLRTRRWGRRRDEALRRQPYCTLCRKTTRLIVHHNTYVRIGDERPDDLVVLCRDCHAKHHGIE
jgi:RNase P subunit RPR2